MNKDLERLITLAFDGQTWVTDRMGKQIHRDVFITTLTDAIYGAGYSAGHQDGFDAAYDEIEASRQASAA